MKVHDVEQNSLEWDALRAGIPTASEFSRLVTAKGEPSQSIRDYAVTLAGEKFAGKPLDPWGGNKWSDRGKDLEASAIAMYEMIKDVDVQRIGFVTSDDGVAGCSPDGAVRGGGGVELKCLKAETHIHVILAHRKTGKTPGGYVQQVQGQMLICEWDWVDLLFYHPDLPPLIVRVTPDREMQTALVRGIDAVSVMRDEVHAQLVKHSKGE